MLKSQWVYDYKTWKKVTGDDIENPQIIIVFGVLPYFRENCYADLREKFPNSDIVGCSTAGTIYGELVDDVTVATFISFEKGYTKLAFKDYTLASESESVGEDIANELNEKDLRHVFILSEGLNINGSDLAAGFNNVLAKDIRVTGGLAGDGTNFLDTYVIANDVAKKNRVVAIGFYGNSLHIKSGCFAGWDEFGAERVITKSKGNVLFEIDEQPALELYKSYLAQEISELPASGLKFPISIRKNNKDNPLIRTLLSIDEDEQSITFAGDVPEGYNCRLMKSNIDKLIDNAGLAAEQAKIENTTAELCIAVSCVGRRIVLSQLVEEEIESVKEKLENTTLITGFYSYGELAPLEGLMECALHNQTMTLTIISETV